MVFIYVPSFLKVFGTIDVNWIPWVVGTITGIILTLMNELRKYILAKRHFNNIPPSKFEEYLRW